MDRWTGVLRRSRREAIVDLLLWAALCVPVVVLAGDPGPWGPVPAGLAPVVTLAGMALVGVAVLLARAHPLAATLIVLPVGPWNSTDAIATTVMGPLDAATPVKVGPLNAYSLAIVVLFYLAGRRTVRGGPASGLIALTLVGGVVLAAVSTCGPLGSGPGLEHTVWIPLLSGFLLTAVAPWTAGRYRFQRAEQLAREHRMIAEQARLRERASIAQDMHDSLGHELALIALRAGALEVAPTLGEEHRGAAGELRAAAGVTTERLRRIVDVLRDDSGPPGPSSTESVDELVRRTRDSGMTVRLEVRGAGPRVPDVVARAVYRVVQESLTNAAKHAPGAPVDVRLAHSARDTVVAVANAAPQARVPQAGRSRAGHGLVGLAERVRLAGGTLSAGPVGGGFTVTARLPHGEDA
ncbi:histidine kinase [Sphaerisporangium sp. TRM90804]|uniref:sensor histidine kinase n=1 Tax=Sphaerisporangium sp. TRM90804 TaxID=3031113 RepID=UPI00244B1A0D|nr:histidine kinase [Sphaerisporangium sp. TRM90804]MDH2430137.1 histidine kinase [Sphaerisporangium sp. TRM90804]